MNGERDAQIQQRRGRLGTTRERVCKAIARAKHSNALGILAEIADEMLVQALTALGRLEDSRGVPIARRFLRHPLEHVRREARRIIEKLERGQEKRSSG